jgi:hypothetical protein
MKRAAAAILAALACLLCSCTYKASSRSAAGQSGSPAGASSSSQSSLSQGNSIPFIDYKGAFVIDEEYPDFINIVNANPIDRDYLIDENNPKYTADQNSLPNKYYTVWEKELDSTVAKLKLLLKGKDLDDFEKSQNAWESYNESEFASAEDVLNASVGVGSGEPALVASQGIERVRYRTLQLAEYCYMITGNFSFSYAGK